MRLAWLAWLLLVPGASAAWTWDAPDAVLADHVVFAAYHLDAAPAADAPIRVEVWLDEFLLMDSMDIDVEAGSHPMVVTPPGAGVLRLRAMVGEAVYDHDIVVADSAYGDGFAEARMVLDGATIRFEDVGAHLALIDVAGDGGALLARAWTSDGGFTSATGPLAGGEPAALLVGHPEDALAQGAWPLQVEVQRDGAAPDPGPLQAPPCGPDVRLRPASLASNGFVWQEGTLVRASHSGPATYRLQGALGGSTSQVLAAAEDPLGHFTFGAPAGPSALLVTTDSTCMVSLRGLPSALLPGRLEVVPVANPVGVSIGFSASGMDGGLPDYAFDARVVRLVDERPGRLVWAGELHGIDGTATVHLNFLEPGDYAITTYAGPTSVQTPPAVGDHQLTFTIAPYGGPSDVGNGTIPPWAGRGDPVQPVQESPLPVGVLIGALWWSARRH